MGVFSLLDHVQNCFKIMQFVFINLILYQLQCDIWFHVSDN